MIPVKDARKILYTTTSETTLAQFQGMFAGVVASELLCHTADGDYFYSLTFSPDVDGLSIIASTSTILLITGNDVNVSYFNDGVKIPFYFISYITE